jgi:hypothetical protein
MGITGSFYGGKVIRRECDHVLHLVPSLRMDKTSSHTLLASTRTYLLYVWKKSLQQFHIEDRRVLTYLAANLVRSCTYIERDITFNWGKIFTSITDYTSVYITTTCVYITTTASTGDSSHRKPASAKNIGHFETLPWKKKFKCMTEPAVNSRRMQATCMMKLRCTGVQYGAHFAGTTHYKM